MAATRDGEQRNQLTRLYEGVKEYVAKVDRSFLEEHAKLKRSGTGKGAADSAKPSGCGQRIRREMPNRRGRGSARRSRRSSSIAAEAATGRGEWVR